MPCRPFGLHFIVSSVQYRRRSFHSEEHKMSIAAAPSHTFSIIDKRNIGVSPAVSECTVAQAARFLDMSEGCVNELLRDNVIHSRLVAGERLVQWESLKNFGADYRAGLEALAEISQEWQEMGLYD